MEDKIIKPTWTKAAASSQSSAVFGYYMLNEMKFAHLAKELTSLSHTNFKNKAKTLVSMIMGLEQLMDVFNATTKFY